MELLRELFAEVLVPNAVADEIARHPAVVLDAGLVFSVFPLSGRLSVSRGSVILLFALMRGGRGSSPAQEASALSRR